MKVVLDTNVFISGIHWSGSSEKILRHWMEDRFTLVSSLPIIEELVKVLRSFKVPLDAEDISWWENLILEKSILVIPLQHIDIIKNDAEDNKFLEAAVEGEALYIISQDKHLLNVKEYQGMKIYHPDEFLTMLRSQNR